MPSKPEVQALYRRRPEVRAREQGLQRIRRSTPEFKLRRSEAFRERYANDPEYREHIKEQTRDRYRRNGSAWLSTDPAWGAATTANKSARKYGLDGLLTTADITSLWIRQPVCLACGEGGGVDHIIPMGLGGPNSLDNIQNLCRRCNSIKHSKPLTPEQIRLRLAVAS